MLWLTNTIQDDSGNQKTWKGSLSVFARSEKNNSSGILSWDSLFLSKITKPGILNKSFSSLSLLPWLLLLFKDDDCQKISDLSVNEKEKFFSVTEAIGIMIDVDMGRDPGGGLPFQWLREEAGNRNSNNNKYNVSWRGRGWYDVPSLSASFKHFKLPHHSDDDEYSKEKFFHCEGENQNKKAIKQHFDESCNKQRTGRWRERGKSVTSWWSGIYFVHFIPFVFRLNCSPCPSVTK